MQQWVLDLEEPVEQQQQDEGEAAPDTPEERSVSDAYPVDANESAASQQGSEEASGSFQGAGKPEKIPDFAVACSAARFCIWRRSCFLWWVIAKHGLLRKLCRISVKGTALGIKCGSTINCTPA